MSLRIAFISPYPPQRDGLATYTRDVAQALAVDDHVGVFTERSPRRRSRTDDLVEVYPVLSATPASARRLVHAVEAFRPDIVHVQFTVPAFGLQTLWVLLALSRLRRRGTIRVVWTLHEVVRELSLLRGVGRALYRAVGALADRIVVLSEASGDGLVEHCGVARSRIVQLPHGVPQRPGGPTVAGRVDGPVVCFGFLHPDKGIEHLITAGNLLRERGAGRPVVVAGAVRPRQGLFRLFERRDHRYEDALRREAGGSVAFPGFLADDVLDEQLRAAQVVVFPYLAVTQSGAINRATALGCPVVASNLPGLAEDVPHPAGLVPPGDVHALAETLAKIDNDPSLQREMSAASAELAVRRSFAAAAARLRELYTAAVSSPGLGT